MNISSRQESSTEDRNAWNGDFIIMVLCWSLVSPSLKHHLQSQVTELGPFKLLKLTRLLFFSFEKRSDKTSYGPLNHRLRTQAPSQKILRFERLHHYGNGKQRGLIPSQGLVAIRVRVLDKHIHLICCACCQQSFRSGTKGLVWRQHAHTHSNFQIKWDALISPSLSPSVITWLCLSLWLSLTHQSPFNWISKERHSPHNAEHC